MGWRVPGSSDPRPDVLRDGLASGPDALPALHVLLSEREIADEAALAAAVEILRTAVPAAVHIRAAVPARLAYERAVALSRAARASGGWCVVNGRPDIALAASAHAVQLGRSALPPAAVAALRPPGSRLRIGASVHDADEAARASADGADYLVWGTAYETPSHPGRPGAGPAGLREVVTALARHGPTVPVLAIGGIDARRVAQLVAAGAAGIVVGRAVWSSRDPVAAATALRVALDAALRATSE